MSLQAENAPSSKLAGGNRTGTPGPSIRRNRCADATDAHATSSSHTTASGPMRRWWKYIRRVYAHPNIGSCSYQPDLKMTRCGVTEVDFRVASPPSVTIISLRDVVALHPAALRASPTSLDHHEAIPTRD